MLKKLQDTIRFYYLKLVKIVDITLDNIVKTVEVTLNKIPATIEDAYSILKANLTINNVISLGLTTA